MANRRLVTTRLKSLLYRAGSLVAPSPLFSYSIICSGSFVAGSQQQSLAEFSLTVSSNEAQHILI